MISSNSSIIIFLSVIVLAGCAKKTKYHIDKANSHIQAFHYDIPIPSKAVRLFSQFFSSDKQAMLGYRTTEPITSVCSFIEDQMILNGWCLSQSVNGPEKLFIFNKPSKSAYVNIRPEARNKYVDIVITIA